MLYLSLNVLFLSSYHPFIFELPFSYFVCFLVRVRERVGVFFTCNANIKHFPFRFQLPVTVIVSACDDVCVQEVESLSVCSECQLADLLLMGPFSRLRLFE